MDGFLSKLKGMVIQDDAPKQETAAPAPAPVMQVAPTPMASAAAVDVTGTVNSVLDTAALEQTIDSIIQSGADFAPFTKFMETATSLEKALKDEATRFASAQAVTNIDKATLIAAVDSHKQVLANEAMNFDAQFVVNSTNAIQSTNDEAAAVAKQISELTVQLGELSEKKTALEKLAVDKAGELAKAKIDFANVIENLGKRYTTLAGKLQQYLGA